MLTAWVFATEAEALRAIAAIDTALGPTEDVKTVAAWCRSVEQAERHQATVPGSSIEPSGDAFVVVVTETRPRLTWGHPIPLRDGTWAVPAKPRLADIGDRTVRVGGSDVRVRRVDEAIPVSQSDRADDEGVR